MSVCFDEDDDDEFNKCEDWFREIGFEHWCQCAPTKSWLEEREDEDEEEERDDEEEGHERRSN